jgi:hypothetical protein
LPEVEQGELQFGWAGAGFFGPSFSFGGDAGEFHGEALCQTGQPVVMDAGVPFDFAQGRLSTAPGLRFACAGFAQDDKNEVGFRVAAGGPALITATAPLNCNCELLVRTANPRARGASKDQEKNNDRSHQATE